MSKQTLDKNADYTTGPYIILDNGDELGTLAVESGIYTDDINENTLSNGVNISGININNNILTINKETTPSAPSSNKFKIYIDSTDNLLKILDSTNIVNIINPLTTKGDILTHNGTSQIRLPSGSNGQVLSVNTSQSSGLQWVDNISNGGSNTTTNTDTKDPLITGTNTYYISYVEGFGSYFSKITPLTEDSSSCIFLYSKKRPNENANTVVLCNNTSIVNNGDLLIRWQPYRSIEFGKNYTEADGFYQLQSNNNIQKNKITLSGTTPVLLDNIFFDTIGVYYFSIHGSSGDPTANIIYIKNIQTSNGGALTILNSVKGTSNNTFNFSWVSNSYPSINKTNSNNDGDYYITDNLNNSLLYSVTLSNTTELTLDFIPIYDKKTIFIKVLSQTNNGPVALFFISKNKYTRNGNILRFSAPGLLSTNLNLTWAPNSLLKLSKTDNNYNGLYDIYLV